MPDKPFVVNDRRKFTAEGDPRPDAPPSEPKPPRPEQLQPGEQESSARLIDTPPKGPRAVPSPGEQVAEPEGDDQLPPPLTAEQTEQANAAYDATIERLDTAIRAANPGAERMPDMTFERLVQSIYMQAIMQLGGTAQEGQQPQVDILGARQSIDMLGIIAKKSVGNMSDAEEKLIDAALFEMRMAFLEVTQALARQAVARQQPGMPPAPGGPSIVR